MAFTASRDKLSPDCRGTVQLKNGWVHMRKMIFAASLLMATGAAQAETCGDTAKGFKGFIAEMKQQAAAEGVSAQSIRILDTLKYDPGIIKKDRAQNVFAQDFLTFQARMATSARVKSGKGKLIEHQATLDAVQKKYGVPGAVIAAFWALETDFGGFMGSSPSVQSIATLAWDCRRPEKFRPQLIAALQLLDTGDLSYEEMKGAWAGEIGQTQFMAYDYNESAVDFDRDGRRDLVNSIPDVLASTANLLRKHGWQPGQPWLQEVTVPEDMPWEEADIAIQHPRKQWAKWGVKAASGKPIKADGFGASLLLPMGRKGPAFLAYDNFTTAYLKWNESLVYSTTAAYLATRIAGAAPVKRGNAEVTPLAHEEVVQLQELLAAKGYDVGKIDGKIGKGTRAAVKDMQLKLGLPPDSYPDQALLREMGGSVTTGSLN
jgi:lytic murein transglycosylase